MPMILVCASDSSSSLRELARPTVRGMTRPGKMTLLRMGRMGSVSGIVVLSPSDFAPTDEVIDLLGPAGLSFKAEISTGAEVRDIMGVFVFMPGFAAAVESTASRRVARQWRGPDQG